MQIPIVRHWAVFGQGCRGRPRTIHAGLHHGPPPRLRSTGQRRGALRTGVAWRCRRLALLQGKPALRYVGPRQTLELARDLIETSVKLAELLAVADGFAARSSVGSLAGIVRRDHVEGAFGLAARFPFAPTLGFARFIAGALDFVPGFFASTLDFERLLARALGFVASVFTAALGFARFVPGAGRLPYPPGAFGVARFLPRTRSLMVARSLAALRLGALAALFLAIRRASQGSRLIVALVAPTPILIARTLALLPRDPIRHRARKFGRHRRRGAGPNSDGRGCSSSSASADRITLLSQSPTDTSDGRAASRTVARVSGRKPLKFHGPPDFILANPRREEPGTALLRARCSTADEARRAILCPQERPFRITVNKRLKIAPRDNRRRKSGYIMPRSLAGERPIKGPEKKTSCRPTRLPLMT